MIPVLVEEQDGREFRLGQMYELRLSYVSRSFQALFAAFAVLMRISCYIERQFFIRQFLACFHFLGDEQFFHR